MVTNILVHVEGPVNKIERETLAVGQRDIGNSILDTMEALVIYILNNVLKSPNFIHLLSIFLIDTLSFVAPITVLLKSE